jgi:hypothetical protein
LNLNLFWTKNSWKFDTVILSAIIAIFLIFFYILAFNNRPVSEDYEFIRIFRQQGWAGSLLFSFNEHSFRLPSKIIFNLFFGFDFGFGNLKNAILLYHLASISFLVFAMFQLLSSIADLFFSKKPSARILLGFSIIWVGAFFFGSFQIADTWFWLISSTIHLQSCTFAILGSAYLLKKRKTFCTYFIMILSFAFAGGSAENLALFLLILLSGSAIYFRLLTKKNANEQIQILFNKTITALVIVFLAFAFNLSGSGTEKRISNQTKINMQFKTSLNKDTDHINEFSFANIHKAIFNYTKTVSLLFSMSWFFFGLWIRKKGIRIICNLGILNSKKAILIAAGITFVVLISTIFPLYYVFGGSGPLRAWTPISMVFSMLSCVLFLLIGYFPYSQYVSVFIRPMVYALVPIILFYLIRQYSFVTEYSKAFDNRYKYLMQLNRSGNIKTIDIEGLPDSGFLPSGDITHDENYILNKNYQYVLGLNFKVKSSDNYFSKYSTPIK